MTEKKTAEKASEAPKPKQAEKLTPIQWAAKLGHKKKYGRGPEAKELMSAAFESANVLYGWSLQAHHWGADSLKLTQEDFEAAMVAASKFPTVRLHEPAIAEVVKEARADFTPLKAHKD